MLANELANRSKKMIDKTKYNYTVEIFQIFTFEDMTIVLDIKKLYGHQWNISQQNIRQTDEGNER